ncbi:BRO family protein [Pseudogracilibacillus sp. SO10305]|uniref:BRO family protein n=1 Tax=Pseudogracilibacillus sp. SO10305 TaxID=3098292 RepID=UPI00300E62BD
MRNSAKVLPRIYEYDLSDVRTARINEKVWVIAEDVCHILNFNSIDYVLEQLNDKDKQMIKSTLFINQNAVYDLIAMSANDEAKHFKSWLNDEVFKAELSLVVDNDNVKENDDKFQLFEHEDLGNVRVILDKSGEPLFNLNDVCGVLEVAPRVVKQRLSKGVCSTYPLQTAGGKQQTTFVNEDGLYDVVLDSRKPQAKKFRKWITSEVLPSIRKHGAYMTENTIEQALTNPDFLIQLATNLKQEQEARKKAEQQSKKLKQQIEIDKPKVKTYEHFIEAKNNMNMNEVAKNIGWGRNKLFAQLRDDEILMNDNQPYQSFVNRGYFEVAVKPISRGGYNRNQNVTLVTAKGAEWLAKKYAK